MDRKVKPRRKGVGRPNEGRVKLTVYVLPETEKRVTIATDKSDPNMNTKGKVIDSAISPCEWMEEMADPVLASQKPVLNLSIKPYQKPILDMISTLPEGREAKCVTTGGRMYWYAVTGENVTHAWRKNKWEELKWEELK